MLVIVNLENFFGGYIFLVLNPVDVREGEREWKGHKQILPRALVVGAAGAAPEWSVEPRG